MGQSREGFYDSEDDARAHIEQVYLDYPQLRGKPIVMLYHFASYGRDSLENFLLGLDDHGFVRHDPYFIDEDTGAAPGEPDHYWVPSRIAIFTPTQLIDEVSKFDKLASAASVVFGGITADPRQGSG